MQQTGVCVCVAVIKRATPAGQYFHTKHVFKWKPGWRRKHFLFFCVQTTFNIESKANSELFLASFCREKQKRRINLKFVCGFSGVQPRRALLLRRTSPRALGEGENVWGHTMWPLAEAAGPPLVQSQPHPPPPPHHPHPPPPQHHHHPTTHTTTQQQQQSWPLLHLVLRRVVCLYVDCESSVWLLSRIYSGAHIEAASNLLSRQL